MILEQFKMCMRPTRAARVNLRRLLYSYHGSQVTQLVGGIWARANHGIIRLHPVLLPNVWRITLPV